MIKFIKLKALSPLCCALCLLMSNISDCKVSAVFHSKLISGQRLQLTSDQRSHINSHSSILLIHRVLLRKYNVMSDVQCMFYNEEIKKSYDFYYEEACKNFNNLLARQVYAITMNLSTRPKFKHLATLAMPFAQLVNDGKTIFDAYDQTILKTKHTGVSEEYHKQIPYSDYFHKLFSTLDIRQYKDMMLLENMTMCYINVIENERKSHEFAVEKTRQIGKGTTDMFANSYTSCIFEYNLDAPIAEKVAKQFEKNRLEHSMRSFEAFINAYIMTLSPDPMDESTQELIGLFINYFNCVGPARNLEYVAWQKCQHVLRVNSEQILSFLRCPSKEFEKDARTFWANLDFPTGNFEKFV